MTFSYKNNAQVLSSTSVHNDLIYLNKDVLLKNTFSVLKDFFKYEKLYVTIHIQKIDKIYDYFILQSICLIDTITSQKPKLRVQKCKYTFGSKSFSYSCKATLRRRKILNFISLFKFIILSEMRRRHIHIASSIDSTKNQFSFSIKNTNVFLKLDEFYFKWNYPIIFNFVGSSNNVVKAQYNFTLPF